MSFSWKCLVGALALTVSACATSARRAPSPWDPSNPDATSSPVRAMTALTASALAPPSAAPLADPGGSPPSPAGYVCPMHPDVTAHAPGRCPKCGMKLVPQGAAHGHGAGARP
jgi:hypothetical protein